MRVLVTGAAGFLGRHIARHMRDAGWSVTGFDLDSFDEKGITSIAGDLTNSSSIADAMTGHTHVIHVGAIGDVYLAGENPALAADVNVVGTANLLAAAQAKSARVVYASTWEVYGEPVYLPLDEDHPTMPDHPYSITKLAGESLVLAASNLEKVETVALRLGTAYGSGLRPNSVFRIFIDRARAGEAITIQGDGAQGRQFTNAADISRAFEMATNSSASGVALNIVAPEMVSIKQLAEIVVEQFPTSLTYGEPRPGDVPSALVSSDRARAVLSWEARVSFKTGLDELMDSVVSQT